MAPAEMSQPGMGQAPGSDRLPALREGAALERFTAPEGRGSIAVSAVRTVPGTAIDADLVDAVVERIEQRVIDELERRGRRQTWSGA